MYCFFGVDWPYAGPIDRNSSSSTSQNENVAATGAVGVVVAEAEPSNQGNRKKAAKVGKGNGFWAKFFDETVPLKKRVWHKSHLCFLKILCYCNLQT